MEENRASTRVMEKLGMDFCGHTLAYKARCVRYEIRRSRFEEYQASGLIK